MLEQRRLEVLILVVGVHLEHLAHRQHVGGDCGAVGPATRIDAAGGKRDVEQLGPDALVDVAVEVDGDEVEVVGGADGVGGGDGHEMVLLVRGRPVGGGS